MQEELQRTKEVHAQAQTVYEKEVRRARKEAFKSSSALVKLQEELKTARNRYTLMRVDAEDHKQKLGAKEEELSAAQQQLSIHRADINAVAPPEPIADLENNPQSAQDSNEESEHSQVEPSSEVSSSSHELLAVQNELREVSEELFMLQQKLSKAERKTEKAEMQRQVVEEERDALKKNMEEEQVARSAAQGAIALPPSRDTIEPFGPAEDDDLDAPKQGGGLPEEAPLQPQDLQELLKLKEEVDGEKRRRLEAEELVHFSQMECQFGCCSCRRAEQRGKPFVNDESFAAAIAELTATSCASEREDTAEMAISERPRNQPFQVRSETPKITMPQRPQSQQARVRQVSPKLLERPRSQQTGDHRKTPRPYQHNRSVTESAFRTARELDSQARRSISHARDSTATPAPPLRKRRSLEYLDGPTPKGKISRRGPEVDDLKVLETDVSSPLRQSSTTDHKAYPALAAPSAQQAYPPSPTMDFNFTEIIPNIPSIPPSIPTPPLPAASQSEDDLFAMGSLKNESTTVTIPLKSETPEFFNSPPDLQSGISREEALAQIRARRGRARSYAASHGAPTPKKGITGTPRREISAPSLKRV